MYEVLLYDNNVMCQTRFKLIALIEYYGWKMTFHSNVSLVRR